MTSKRILALSITSAMVLAACQQPAPAPVVASPTVSNVVANPSTVTQGNNVSTTVTFSTTNGGGVISSAKANLSGVDTTCNLASGSTSNYTCNVPVPSSLGTGSKNITVTVTNNAPTGNTATGSTSVTVNPAPVVEAPSPTFTATGPAGDSTAGNNVAVVISNLVAGTGTTITGITATLNGVTTNCNLTANGTCSVPVPSNSNNGSGTIVVTATNSGGKTASQPVNINVTGGTGGVIVQQGAPTVTISQVAPGVVNIIAAAGGSTTLKTVVVTVTKQGGSSVTFPIASAVGQAAINQPLDISSALAEPGSYTVSVVATNSSNLPASASLNSNITVVTPPTPPMQGGGSAGAFSQLNPLTIRNTADIITDSQYRWADIDQVIPTSTTPVRLRYVRGTFGIADLNSVSSGALPQSGPGIIYYLSNTTTNPGNIILGNVNTNGLAQGQLYYIVARRQNTDGSQIVVGSFQFVPDNKGPQTPKIQPQSKLNVALTSAYGNWVGGGARVGLDGVAFFNAENASFAQTLTNTRSLEDNPVAPVPVGTNPSNPQNNVVVPPSGFATVQYYAVRVPNTFVGDPGAVASGILPLNAQGNYNLVGAILLGGVSGNVDLSENYKIRVNTSTAASTSIVPGTTPVGSLQDGRYVVFAVAYDQLGNRNQIDFQDSYILNVDNAGPTGNVGIVDRGPLDVNAISTLTPTSTTGGVTSFSGSACQRVDISTNPQLAPDDIFEALRNQSIVINGITVTGVNFVSGCAVAGGSITDGGGIGTPPSVGIGFDNQGLGGAGQNVAPGTIAGPSNGVSTPLNFITGPTGLTATLADTVINLNGVAGGLVPFNGRLTDLLGNQGNPTVAPVFVDNKAPMNVNISVASQNGSNTFDAWQSAGVTATADDNGGSGLRAGETGKNFTFYYGTDAATGENDYDDFNGAYPNTLIQINPSATENLSADQVGGLYSAKANFNLPDPSNGEAQDELDGYEDSDREDYSPAELAQIRDQIINSNTLNIWAQVADRAGNSSAGRTKIVVDPASQFTPSITQDQQGRGFPPFSENGSSGPYQGLTALNRSINGNVPLLTNDQLPAFGFTGPDALLAYGDPSSNGLFPLTDYRTLPVVGFNGTSVYELRVSGGINDGILFNGDSRFNTGIGRTSFVYRLPDPQEGSSNGPRGLTGVNPISFWPNTPAASVTIRTLKYPPATPVPSRSSVNPTELRFLYNLPAWSGGDNADNVSGSIAREDRVVGLWNNIADVEKAPFRAVFEAALTNLNAQADGGSTSSLIFRQGAIGVFAYNNYGNVDIQVKGTTSGFELIPGVSQ